MRLLPHQPRAADCIVEIEARSSWPAVPAAAKVLLFFRILYLPLSPLAVRGTPAALLAAPGFNGLPTLPLAGKAAPLRAGAAGRGGVGDSTASDDGLALTCLRSCSTGAHDWYERGATMQAPLLSICMSGTPTTENSVSGSIVSLIMPVCLSKKPNSIFASASRGLKRKGVLLRE